MSEFETSQRLAPSRLEPSVVSRLRRVGSRLRWYLFLEGVGVLALYLLIALIVQFLIDYKLHGVRWSLRAAMLVLIIASGLWIIVRRIIEPLRIKCGLPEIANLIEKRFPQLQSSLISAVRFSAGAANASGQSESLMASVVDQGGRNVQSVNLQTMLNPNGARRGAAALIGVLAITTLACLLTPELVHRWFQRNVLLHDVAWPKQTRLMLDHEGNEYIAARGDDVVIQAHAEGRSPREVDIVFRTDAGQRGRETMITVGREGALRYRHTFKTAQENLSFYLVGGDDQTEPFTIRLMERPSIESTSMSILPPPYTGLSASNYGDGQRSAQILPGSSVRLGIHTNKPLRLANLLSGDRKVAEADPVENENNSYVVHVNPAQSETYQFALSDEYGLENKQVVSFAFRMIKDDSPTVQLKLNGVGDMITQDAILPIELQSADTYGLATTAIDYQLSRDEGLVKQIDLPDFTPQTKTYTQRLSWKVTDAGAVPGETLKMSAHASDFDDISGPNVGKSQEFRMRVVTHDELLAELARREQEHRADFERLVDAQEQLRGQLLSELRKLEGGATSAETVATIAPLERRQRSVAASVNVVRQQFERMLTERRINQLQTEEEEERLGRRIVDPLSNLSKRDLTAAADALRQWSAGGSVELARRVDAQQAVIVSQMREILANMLEWEGYQEVVSMLRDILRLQKDLNDETKKAAENQGEGLFEN